MDKNEISEIIGDYCEGCGFSEGDEEVIINSLKGYMETNQGSQRFYVDLEAISLENIDYSEAIWYLGKDEIFRGDENEIIFLDEIFNSKIVDEKTSLSSNPELKEKLYKKIINPLEKLYK